MISPSLALPQSNAFPMPVTPSSITKVWARTQHAPSFGVMRTALCLHLRNQTMYLPTVSFRVLPSYVLWAYFIILEDIHNRLPGICVDVPWEKKSSPLYQWPNGLLGIDFPTSICCGSCVPGDTHPTCRFLRRSLLWPALPSMHPPPGLHG